MRVSSTEWGNKNIKVTNFIQFRFDIGIIIFKLDALLFVGNTTNAISRAFFSNCFFFYRSHQCVMSALNLRSWLPWDTLLLNWLSDEKWYQFKRSWFCIYWTHPILLSIIIPSWLIYRNRQWVTFNIGFYYKS